MSKPIIKDANLKMLGDAMSVIVIRDGFGEATGAAAVVLARTIRMANDMTDDEYHQLLGDLTGVFSKHLKAAKVIS